MQKVKLLGSIRILALVLICVATCDSEWFRYSWESELNNSKKEDKFFKTIGMAIAMIENTKGVRVQRFSDIVEPLGPVVLNKTGEYAYFLCGKGAIDDEIATPAVITETLDSFRRLGKEKCAENLEFRAVSVGFEILGEGFDVRVLRFSPKVQSYQEYRDEIIEIKKGIK